TRMGHGHGGARTMHMGGGALMKAIDGALAKAMPVAARLLQTDADAVTFANGAFATADGASVTLAAVAGAARAEDSAGGGLETYAKVEDAPFTFPNGCHAAEVEIDPDTGAVTLARYVTAEDYGNLINPRLTVGQVRGGLAQGIGQALREHAVYDAASGQLLAGSLMDYAVPMAGDLPDLEVNLENGVATDANPLGVKGSGQAGAIAAPQTVIHAVLDALAPLGVTHIDMPATSETIWRAIRAAKNSG
ncbi:MAG: molybdopterin cofactor-binding domain-containing protein, partial [Rhodospirillaceae bacterium]